LPDSPHSGYVTFLFILNSVFDFVGEENDLKSRPPNTAAAEFSVGLNAFIAGRDTIIAPGSPRWRAEFGTISEFRTMNRIPSSVLLLCLAVIAGCTAHVKVERTNGTNTTTTETKTAEINRTEIAVDLRPPANEPKQPQPPQSSSPTVSAEDTTNVCANTVTIVYRGGDTHYHLETNVHAHEPRYVQHQIVIRPEPRTQPPREVDPRCERLRSEHEERVRQWKAIPLGE
jgi:hypothetical protein